MTRALVTGATGFVGQAVIPALQAKGWDVRAAVRSPAPSLYVPTVQVGEIDGGTDWAQALNGVDLVVHLAARTHVMQEAGPASEAEALYRRLNVDGTRALAEAARVAQVKRFVFMSSIKVNGEETPPDRPFQAADRPSPEDAYGRTKWLAEKTLWDIAQEEPMSVTVLRPPLVHGPGVKGNLAALLRLIAKGRPLPLGSVRNARSLVSRDNLAHAVAHVAGHEGAQDKTYLISDGEPVSTADLARHLAAGLGTPARIVPVPPGVLRLGLSVLGKGAIYRRLAGSLVVDSSPLCEELDWTPPVNMVESLKATGSGYAG